MVAGSGEPVVLLPGWPESGISWRKMIPLLTATGRQVYVLEPRSFGDSDKPQTGYDSILRLATCTISWWRRG
nr:alpha/beta hydrolase [Rhizobium sp. T1473]